MHIVSMFLLVIKQFILTTKFYSLNYGNGRSRTSGTLGVRQECILNGMPGWWYKNREQGKTCEIPHTVDSNPRIGVNWGP